MFNQFGQPKAETGFEPDILEAIYYRNFHEIPPHHVYLVYKFIHLYPRTRQSTSSFNNIFYNTLERMANQIDEIDYALRLSPYNHVLHFPYRVTAIVDTFIVFVSTPVNHIMARVLYNPKYAGCVLKWQVDFLGHILVLTGPHVAYDGHIFVGTGVDHLMYDWELWLGDGHYIGIDNILSPYRNDLS